MELAISCLALSLVVGIVSMVFIVISQLRAANRQTIAMSLAFERASDKLMVFAEKGYIERLVVEREARDNQVVSDFPKDGYRDTAKTPADQWTKAPEGLFGGDK